MKSSINKFLAVAVVALLAINIVLAFLLVKDKPHSDRPKNGNRGDWVINELKLTEEQKKQHKAIKDAHFIRLKPVMDSITSAKSSLYYLLKDSSNVDSLIKAYTYIIGVKHALVSQYTFEHFKKIRAICTPEQQVKLDELIQKIVKDMGKKGTGSRDDDRK